jgi:hypothetical protein
MVNICHDKKKKKVIAISRSLKAVYDFYQHSYDPWDTLQRMTTEKWIHCTYIILPKVPSVVLRSGLYRAFSASILGKTLCSPDVRSQEPKPFRPQIRNDQSWVHFLQSQNGGGDGWSIQTCSSFCSLQQTGQSWTELCVSSCTTFCKPVT